MHIIVQHLCVCVYFALILYGICTDARIGESIFSAALSYFTKAPAAAAAHAT